MSNTFTRDPSPRVQYSGDGSRTTFDFPFPVLASDDLLVFVNDAAATGFAVSGLNDPAGGEIAFAIPPAAGASITLLRRTEGIRETDFVDGGPFRAAAINAEFDRVMLLIQENREEHNRALRGRPAEAGNDFCLPAPGARANRVLGFDSAGRPMAFGTDELPTSGDASGALVTAEGGTTARLLGEHLAALINVRDHGALGDGVTDDHAAFAAAIAAAQTVGKAVYVPASATAYLLGAQLTLAGVALVGDGPGSMIRLALAAGSALELDGHGARVSDLRLLGPGVNDVAADPGDLDFDGVSLTGVMVAGGAKHAVMRGVEVLGCHIGLAIEGSVAALTDCGFTFNRTGIALRSGATGSISATSMRFHGCTTGVLAEGGAGFGRFALRGGAFSACGRALALDGADGAWRGVDVADVTFADNLEVDLEAGPRQTVGLRNCHLDDSGKRRGVPVDLQAAGETVEAPALLVEDTYAATTDVAVMDLSGGSNLDLLAKGDLVVLAADADDIDDHWTSLKATRGGVIQKVVSQTTSTATIKLASASLLPRVQVGDQIRVVGRAGTAMVDSVAASIPAGDFVWLHVNNHCRVFAAHNPMARDQIELGGASSELRYWPGLGDEAVEISEVELDRGALNGALTRLYTFEIAQDTAVSFKPPASIGMLQAFPLSLVNGDPISTIISYRADPLGYTELLATGTTTSSDVEVAQRIALAGTTGNDGKLTFSAHTDGKIYIENQRAGPLLRVAVHVVGAPV